MTFESSAISRRGGLLAVGIMALALVTACSSNYAKGSDGAATPSPPPTVTPTSTPVPPPGAVTAAVAQAAADAGVPVSDVSVTDFHSVDWNDGALGCPEPGKFYQQVITPGYVVLLRVAGQDREYHTDLGQRVVSCDGASG